VGQQLENYHISSLIGTGIFADVYQGVHLYLNQNLPVPLTPLVGREQDLQAACARLLRPEVRLLTLTGTPGVGKTRLALALGEMMLETFAQGVCFVSLAPISDPELVVPTIADTLGLHDSDMRPIFERLKSFLRDKQLLLLLDNFEQVLPAAPLLVELLSGCLQLKLAVTSRAVLHVQGEYEFAVPPLAIPDPQALPAYDSLSQVAAVELFVQRAEAVKPGFQLTENNAATIAEICARLGGVPLAIELAAARSKLLSPQALLSRLEHGLEVLSGGRQDAPSRQQALCSAINWSYDLLTAEEQTLFRRLCIFVGDFTLEEAEAVSTVPDCLPTSVLEGVASLVDKSLLQQREEEGQKPRLYLLEIMREYGLERLAERGELERCREAHAAYYLTLRGQGEARTRLGEKSFALAWTTGLAMTPEQAVGAETQETQTTLPTQDSIVPPAKPQPSPAPVIPNGLTVREVEVLRLVAQGMSNSQIAEQLVLSANTVNAHIQSIYRKLDVNSRSAATRFAMEHLLL
jgi:predicted ATPase/DNA-binding CsgD family transcriptional regulator